METKRSLKTKLTNIKNALNIDSLDQHFDAILSEIEDYTEKEKVLSSDNLPLPKEIKTKTDLALFSDGACRGNPGPGSWGYMIQDASGEKIKEGSDFETPTTNNRMELKGAINALIAAQSFQDSKLYLYTDSKYVVDGVEKWVEGWKRRGWKKADKKAPENLDLWQELDGLVQRMNVKLLWVKGHAGHPQNEYCDQLANKALDLAGY